MNATALIPRDIAAEITTRVNHLWDRIHIASVAYRATLKPSRWSLL
jgi:hypothetical protein